MVNYSIHNLIISISSYNYAIFAQYQLRMLIKEEVIITSSLKVADSIFKYFHGIKFRYRKRKLDNSDKFEFDLISSSTKNINRVEVSTEEISRNWLVSFDPAVLLMSLDSFELRASVGAVKREQLPPLRLCIGQCGTVSQNLKASQYQNHQHGMDKHIEKATQRSEKNFECRKKIRGGPGLREKHGSSYSSFKISSHRQG